MALNKLQRQLTKRRLAKGRLSPDASLEIRSNLLEIGDYFDQPVRIYSSEMMLRLAFASAITVRPELLILDEALEVGDIFSAKMFPQNPGSHFGLFDLPSRMNLESVDC